MTNFFEKIAQRIMDFFEKVAAKYLANVYGYHLHQHMTDCVNLYLEALDSRFVSLGKIRDVWIAEGGLSGDEMTIIREGSSPSNALSLLQRALLDREYEKRRLESEKYYAQKTPR